MLNFSFLSPKNDFIDPKIYSKIDFTKEKKNKVIVQLFVE